MTYREQFPDYPPKAFPPIPEGFEDCSWHNNACPCLVSDVYQMTIWLDYEDPAQRENGPSYARFTVTHQQHGIETGRWAEYTDSWSDVLRIIERRKP